MNTIKYIYDFSSANSVTLGTAIYLLIFLIIFSINAAKILLYGKKNKTNQGFFEISFISQVKNCIVFHLLLIAVCQVFSLIFFCITTIWVEYPLFEKSQIWYKNDKNQWVKTEDRLIHKPFLFDGYTLTRDKKGLVTIDPFVLEYSISEEDMPYVLDNVTDLDKDGINIFIRKKSKELFFKNNNSDLIDSTKRLEIFKSHYKPYGITIHSVEFP